MDASRAIMVSEADLIIAGGVEDMEKVPMMSGMTLFNSLWKRYNPAEIPMGNTAEKVAKIYDVSRKDMENMAIYSHKKALTGSRLSRLAVGFIVGCQTFFKSLLTPYQASVSSP